jgi:hypothetical protein
MINNSPLSLSRLVSQLSYTSLESATTLTPLEYISELNERYPELSWLTGDVNATPEASVASDGKAKIGETLYPNLEVKSLVEFERTAVGLVLLEHVRNGDYESFVECQPEATRLSRVSFDELRASTDRILPDNEAYEAMQTFMVINDIGKVKNVVDQAQKEHGIANVDHDILMLDLLRKDPSISPSFLRLDSTKQRLIIDGLATKFNLGQLLQAESIPGSLGELQGADLETLEFFLLHTYYDIAAVAGQNKQNGSAIMNQSTHTNFCDSRDAAVRIANQSQTPVESYDQYLGSKASQLELDISDPRQKAITRICCMLRKTSKGDSDAVISTFDVLDANTQTTLIDELTKDGINDEASWLYYGPAMLGNLTTKDSVNGLKIGLTTMARVYQESKSMFKGGDNVGAFTIMANELASEAANGGDFRRPIIIERVSEFSGIARFGETLSIEKKSSND